MGVNYTNVASKIKEYNFSVSQIAQIYVNAKLSLKRSSGWIGGDKCEKCPFHTELKAGRDCSCTDVVRKLYGSIENHCDERLQVLIETLDKKRTIINGRFAKI